MTTSINTQKARNTRARKAARAVFQRVDADFYAAKNPFDAVATLYSPERKAAIASAVARLEKGREDLSKLTGNSPKKALTRKRMHGASINAGVSV